jgi:hypothetical protein
VLKHLVDSLNITLDRLAHLLKEPRGSSRAAFQLVLQGLNDQFVSADPQAPGALINGVQ